MTDPHQNQDPHQPQGQYGQPSHPGHHQQMYPPRLAQMGFFARVFDLSFNHFVTTSLIKVIFVAILAFQTLWALITLISAFNTSATAGLLALFLVPLGLFFGVLLTRVWMELLIVIFKIKEDLGAIRNRGGF
ncbi:DUF4282 domain-containing protein [Sphaerisporangium aureirubrum]|uniref:DUF4282 domain-containing protein n=1 Tax=Sphaerisporangium aureirubrum TaxID=1544736 RepID=A0ABW1NRL5_9ACTN